MLFVSGKIYLTEVGPLRSYSVTAEGRKTYVGDDSHKAFIFFPISDLMIHVLRKISSMIRQSVSHALFDRRMVWTGADCQLQQSHDGRRGRAQASAAQRHAI